jgi:semaphorin 6
MLRYVQVNLVIAESTSDIIGGDYGTEKVQLIYGVFSNTANSIGGSAICAFRVNDIINTFDGAFKGPATANALWQRVPNSKVFNNVNNNFKGPYFH